MNVTTSLILLHALLGISTALGHSCPAASHGLKPIGSSFDPSDRTLAVVPARSSTELRNGGYPTETSAPTSFRSWLRKPTAKELKKADRGLREAYRAVQAAGGALTPEEVFEIVPNLVPNRPLVFEGTVSIYDEDCAVGLMLITKDIPEIRTRERDAIAYVQEMQDTETGSIVDGSYKIRHAGQDSYVELRTRSQARDRTGCSPFKLEMEILEHWVGNVLTVDYRATGDVHYFRGVDEWRPVVDGQGRLYGWLMLSVLQFDIADCWDSDGDMLDTLEENMLFTAGG